MVFRETPLNSKQRDMMVRRKMKSGCRRSQETQESNNVPIKGKSQHAQHKSRRNTRTEWFPTSPKGSASSHKVPKPPFDIYPVRRR